MKKLCWREREGLGRLPELGGSRRLLGAMAGSPEEKNTSLPVIFGFCGGAIAAVAFGAGFGASSYRRSVAFKDLVEKFPEPPTAEAEQLARSGAGRALLGGTALAGLMGLGAVAVARSNGIMSAQDLADEIKRWLPSKAALEVCRARSSVGQADGRAPPPASRRPPLPSRDHAR